LCRLDVHIDTLQTMIVPVPVDADILIELQISAPVDGGERSPEAGTGYGAHKTRNFGDSC
jgi:hypothetical protein